MKKFALAAIGLILVVAAVAAYELTATGVVVEAAYVTTGTIREFIDERGTTRLPETHRITMPFNGRVQAIALTEGTRVAAGDVVAQVVPLDLDITLAAAQAAVERLDASINESADVSVEETTLEQSRAYAESMDRTVEAAAERVKSGEAKLTYANNNLSRISTLYERGNSSVDEMELAEVRQVEGSVDYQQDVLVLRAMQSTQAATSLFPKLVEQYIQRKNLTLAVLEREKAEAEANLRQVKKDQDRGIMTSPVDGVILSRQITNERPVSAGAVLLEIGQLNQLQIEADVLSQEVVRVKPGDAVEVYGPAIGDTPVSGIVANVYPAGFTKVSSLGVEQQRVRVIIDFDPDDLERLLNEQQLGVGYRARVRVITAEKSSALLVPRAAPFRSAKGGWQLYAIVDGHAQLTDVELGVVNDQWVEITAGLSEGDTVIVAPESSLTKGDRVEPQFR